MGQQICIICNSFPPEIGAAPTRIYHLAHLLQRNGYDVEVICGLPNYPLGKIFPDYRGKVVYEEEQEGIRVKRVWLYPSNSRRLLHRLFSMLSHSMSLWTLAFPGLLRHKPDLFIVSSPPLFMALTGAVIGRLCGRKVLLNISDIYPSTASDLGLLRKGWRYRRLEDLEKRLYRKANAIMGQSEEILAHVRAQLQPETKPSFLYRNLLPAQEAPPIPCQPGKTRRIIYAGLLGPVQGIYELCRQTDFGSLGLELHLYGEGPDRSRIEAYLSERPDSGLVLHPATELESMPGILQMFDAALVPLKTPIRGAVPSKLYAALAAGIPVFFSGDGEGAGLIRSRDLGWVSPAGDYEALYQRLRDFSLMSPEDYSALKDRCRAAAQHLLSKEQQDRAFLDFIRLSFFQAS